MRSALGSLEGQPSAFFPEMTPGLLAGLELAVVLAECPVTTGCTQLTVWTSFACLLKLHLMLKLLEQKYVETLQTSSLQTYAFLICLKIVKLLRNNT